MAFIDLTDIDAPEPIGSLVNTPTHPVPPFDGAHTATWYPSKDRNVLAVFNNE